MQNICNCFVQVPWRWGRFLNSLCLKQHQHNVLHRVDLYNGLGELKLMYHSYRDLEMSELGKAFWRASILNPVFLKGSSAQVSSTVCSGGTPGTGPWLAHMDQWGFAWQAATGQSREAATGLFKDCFLPENRMQSPQEYRTFGFFCNETDKCALP